MRVILPDGSGDSPTRVIVPDDKRLARECLAAQFVRNGIDADGAWDLPSLFGRLDTGAPTPLDTGAPTVILLNIGAGDATTLLQVSLDLDPAVAVVVFGLSRDREPEVIACAEIGVAGLHLDSESFEDLLAMVRLAGVGKAQCSPEVSAILLRRAYAFAVQPHPDPRAGSLTAREKEILELLEQGLTNQQIASRLSVSLHTVKNHVHSLLTKFGVGSRAEVAAVFREQKYSGAAAVRR